MRWHPDRCSASGSIEEAKLKFQAIQEAYSVLFDSNKRFLYDARVYDSDDDENRWHPDRCSTSRSIEEANVKFQAIQKAYSVLSDSNKRFLYDARVYDSDDDENSFGYFLRKMAQMMSQTKPTVSLQVASPLGKELLKAQQLGLYGEHQYLNASLAVTLSSTCLQRTGHAESLFSNSASNLPEQFARGLAMANLQGRAQVVPDPHISMQTLSSSVEGLVFYLDGAHSPEILEVCARWFSHVSKEETEVYDPMEGESHNIGKSTKILLFNRMSVRDQRSSTVTSTSSEYVLALELHGKIRMLWIWEGCAPV